MFEGTVLVSVASQLNNVHCGYFNWFGLFFSNETWHFQVVLTELLMQSPKSSGMLHGMVSLTGTSV